MLREKNTPGDWKFVLEGKGLFSCFPLKKDQIEVIMERFHIYFPYTGRINMAGLNETAVERLVIAIDYVVLNIYVQ